MEEIWKNIYDSTTYEISNYGRVRNAKTKKYLKIQQSNSRLKLFRLQYKVGYVVRGGLLGIYVAKHFIDNPYNYKYIRYLDGDYLNNRSDNIEWCMTKQAHSNSHNIVINEYGRTCSKCLNFLLWKNFSKVSSGPNKKDCVCKSCRKVERYKNSDKIKKSYKKYKNSKANKINKEKNKEINKEKRKNYINSSVLYESFVDRLTIDEDPKKTYGGKLKVRCSFCGEYFIPTYQDVSNRVQALNGNYAGERRLYCSQKCKDSCPIYYKSLYRRPKNIKNNHTLARSKEWVSMVLERDKYTCQECGSTEKIIAHHIIPVADDFIYSADISNGISLCEECHKIKHKEINGCGYYEIGRCD